MFIYFCFSIDNVFFASFCSRADVILLGKQVFFENIHELDLIFFWKKIHGDSQINKS